MMSYDMSAVLTVNECHPAVLQQYPLTFISLDGEREREREGGGGVRWGRRQTDRQIANRDRDRETDGQIDREKETDRQTDRHRQTDSYKHRLRAGWI